MAIANTKNRSVPHFAGQTVFGSIERDLFLCFRKPKGENYEKVEKKAAG